MGCSGRTHEETRESRSPSAKNYCPGRTLMGPRARLLSQLAGWQRWGPNLEVANFRKRYKHVFTLLLYPLSGKPTPKAFASSDNSFTPRLVLKAEGLVYLFHFPAAGKSVSQPIHTEQVHWHEITTRSARRESGKRTPLPEPEPEPQRSCFLFLLELVFCIYHFYLIYNNNYYFRFRCFSL